jgi:hypothetical protein
MIAKKDLAGFPAKGRNFGQNVASLGRLFITAILYEKENEVQTRICRRQLAVWPFEFFSPKLKSRPALNL